MKKKGYITQVIGAIVDVRFPDGHSPQILNAITITDKDGTVRTFEVAQHLGERTIRAIAMEPTDGLKRGDEVFDT
jgi:F-type H+-transporting ATPase subunit beta